MNRRQVFQGAAAAIAGFPTIVKAQALGLQGAVAPSDRVTMATVGVGWMGGGHVDAFLKVPQAQYLAVCDIDEEHAKTNKAKIDKKYGNNDCVMYRAFEEVFLRKDIDAVSIALPDHWHGIASVLALRHGKDVYGEKPLAHNFREGKAIVDTQAQYKRMWQTGSWQRSTENFRKACELVRNGRIGKISKVEVGLPGGWSDFNKTKEQTQITEPPAGLDYERWTGPSKMLPFIMARFHKNWRWNLNYAGGQLMDWVGHHVDIAHWGMGWDNTGPLTVEGVGEYPAKDAVWNTAGKYRVVAQYPGNVEMIIAGGHRDIAGGTKWIGDKGWVAVNRGKLEASEPAMLTDNAPVEMPFPKSPGHYQQFIESVKSRAQTLTPAAVALRSATPGWLGQIAMLTGRKLKWDADKMEIVGDAGATQLLSRDMRAPYRL